MVKLFRAPEASVILGHILLNNLVLRNLPEVVIIHIAHGKLFIYVRSIFFTIDYYIILPRDGVNIH